MTDPRKQLRLEIERQQRIIKKLGGFTFEELYEYVNIVEAERDRYKLALENCYALARAKLRRPSRTGDWPDVIRFCQGAGLASTILRRKR